MLCPSLLNTAFRRRDALSLAPTLPTLRCVERVCESDGERVHLVVNLKVIGDRVRCGRCRSSPKTRVVGRCFNGAARVKLTMRVCTNCSDV
jgi:hypothetical protein